ncbi:MAG: Regulator of sigma D [Porticoccaceae bacterium UBA1117]|jgi:regulator of sigma D|nr:sigma D regulator [Porticoccaceae bacterium]CAI8284710.1 MAG: Regulator of sigma D [Porticoccaceae bacterium UBA1117]|tara:strand:+ start:431 stop:916 length:486 start_codon:yes stop_codon:yes gene_type:complete
MVKDNQKLQSHWSNVSKIIERWLEERRELLAKYCDLTEVIDVSDNAVKHVEELQEFCELMVDYISVGHFEIFDQLHKEGQLFEDASGLDKEPNLLEKIQTTTEYILDFNDKYLSSHDLDARIIDLASLGEIFAQRFGLEDKLIDVLHSSHVGTLLGEKELI